MKIIFAGTPEFSADILEALIETPHEICAVYTQPDRPKGRGRKLAASPVKVLAEKHGLALHQPKTLKDLDEQKRIAAYQADLILVVAYGLLLPKAVLDLPKRGCVNIHASLLPKYRGASPIQAAILAQDNETGISYMLMDPGMDTGPVLKQVPCNISATETATSLTNKLSQLAALSLATVLAQLAAGELQATPQDASHACYAGKITKADACIDWSGDAKEIEHVVRAYNPWPVAYSACEGERVRIWQAEASDSPATKPPGTLVSYDKQGLTVACGRGHLVVQCLQLPGGKPLLVNQLLNAKHKQFYPGQILGH